MAGLLWLRVDTNLALRLQTWRLVQLGVNQKVIAGHMHMTESTFSRWLRQETERPASVDALDGLRKFLASVQEEISRDYAALSDEDRERLESELIVTKGKRAITRRERNAEQKRHPRKGKTLARR